jgi:predicted phage terminase large subunit-like protein
LTIPPPLQDRERRQQLRSQLGPRFANWQQRVFFDSEAAEILYSGAFGAGKSRILCEKAHALALRYPGVPIGIFRKVAASLAATTRLTYVQDVLRKHRQPFTQNKTEGWIEYPNGSRVWFLGLDPDPDTGVPSKVGSLDLAYAFVDEAVELDEADWIMLLGRLRSQMAPYRQIGAATNPADPNHWLKQRFTPSTERRVYLHARTADNKLLPLDYIERADELTGLFHARYAEGQWIAVEGALWSTEDFREYREPPSTGQGGVVKPEYVRIAIGVDPAVTATTRSDETGIIVAGIGVDGRAYILDDWSGRFAPDEWANRVKQAYEEWSADLIVAEVNQGGDLVESNLRAASSYLPIRKVTATRGKTVRAEPIANLYKQGRVSHVRRFAELEQQLVTYDPSARTSPDRLDALVWVLTELMITAEVGGQYSMIA